MVNCYIIRRSSGVARYLSVRLTNTGYPVYAANKEQNPEEIPDLIEFLLSEISGWIIGQVFHVDRGMPTIKI